MPAEPSNQPRIRRGFLFHLVNYPPTKGLHMVHTQTACAYIHLPEEYPADALLRLQQAFSERNDGTPASVRPIHHVFGGCPVLRDRDDGLLVLAPPFYSVVESGRDWEITNHHIEHAGWRGREAFGLGPDCRVTVMRFTIKTNFPSPAGQWSIDENSVPGGLACLDAVDVRVFGRYTPRGYDPCAVSSETRGLDPKILAQEFCHWTNSEGKSKLLILRKGDDVLGTINVPSRKTDKDHFKLRMLPAKR